jgi:hypothetical protein
LKVFPDFVCRKTKTPSILNRRASGVCGNEIMSERWRIR